MPGYDGTGPAWGGGPRMGWGLGPCGAGMGFRRGLGRNRGFGFGRRARMMFSYVPQENWTKQDELKALSEEQKMLKDELSQVEKEMTDLEKSAK